MLEKLDKFDSIKKNDLILVKAGNSKTNRSFFDIAKGIYNGIINTSFQE